MIKYIISEEEKRRILNLHEGFKNRVLTEQYITKKKNLNEAPESYLQQVKMITDRSTIAKLNDPVVMLQYIHDNINGVLNYYEIDENNKIVDKETKGFVPAVVNIGGYFKPQIESIMFSARPGGVNEARLSEMQAKKTEIINSKPFKEFFGEYDAIKYKAFDKDWYTDEKCSLMKPKSPACISS
jgi:hypothetical protein